MTEHIATFDTLQQALELTDRPILLTLNKKAANSEFTKLCMSLSYHTQIEELDCSISFQRRKSSLSREQILSYPELQFKAAHHMGIKLIPSSYISQEHPLRTHYLECLTKLPSKWPADQTELFVWSYCDFEHLETILNAFPSQFTCYVPHQY